MQVPALKHCKRICSFRHVGYSFPPGSYIASLAPTEIGIEKAAGSGYSNNIFHVCSFLLPAIDEQSLIRTVQWTTHVLQTEGVV